MINRRTDQRGFTLIELMVVIVILGILAGFVGPKLMKSSERAREAKARSQIVALETALKMYKLDNGSYPTTDQGLQALVEPPQAGQLAKRWKSGGYLEKSIVPKDPWGNEYVYLSPGTHSDFDLSSYGADSMPGGEDENTDVNNWEIDE